MEKYFFKLYYKDCCEILMASSNNYVRILGCIIKHANTNNEINIAPKDIAKLVDCSTDTVHRAIKDLIACDFLRRVSSTQFMLNPACLLRGHYCRYPFLLQKFNALLEIKTDT